MTGRETVLYYSPNKDAKTRKVKSVLVRLGIRIKNISEEQFGAQVGTLAGVMESTGKLSDDASLSELAGKRSDGIENSEASDAEILTIPEEVLVLCNFTEAGLDRLLRELRKSNASVALKAVLTETNCAWSFYELYQEVRMEHESMSRRKEIIEK
ncbi:MAG: DUF3783 domain-containing protein [Clostridiales bacterium]|nr:DUF3783 domain-containing protein [Clostridiales bacterium]